MELITYFDDATGERTGLTATEVGGWSAATAELLTDECGLEPGDRVAVLLPPHWQTAAVLLGAWSAGLRVSFRGWATAGLSPAGDPLDATFVSSARARSWLDEVPKGRHQFALSLGDCSLPEGYRDYAVEVRPHLGAGRPATEVTAHQSATVDGTTFGEYEALAAAIAHARGIRTGDRVLIDTAAHDEPLFWLLAPLSRGASIVLCANLDRDRLDERVAQENVTRVLAG